LATYCGVEKYIMFFLFTEKFVMFEESTFVKKKNTHAVEYCQKKVVKIALIFHGRRIKTSKHLPSHNREKF
jgi:hypothetical protein